MVLKIEMKRTRQDNERVDEAKSTPPINNSKYSNRICK